MTTGWALATSEPNSTIRSDAIRSVYEIVVAPAPTIVLSAAVDGAWHTRAALSTLLEPRKRVTFPAV